MRCGVFVDAGYLFAQGSTLLLGEKRARAQLLLDKDAVIAELRLVMTTRAPLASLLRVYWYDGAGSTGPSAQHFGLAYSDDIKLRLGFLNSQGQQKGVDSLIVTDLIDLARNQAITDAVLLSGDEDVRVGVHIAQTYGVRVHLLGIAPSRGSQSQLLLQVSDTTTEWSKEIVSKFLGEAHYPPALAAESLTAAEIPMPRPVDTGLPMAIEKVLADVATAVAHDDTLAAATDISIEGMLPREIDGRLLTTVATKLGRQLENVEKRALRGYFKRVRLSALPK